MVEEVPFWRIVKNDYVALLLAIASPSLLAGVAYKWFEMSQSERDWGLYVTGVLALVCAVFLVRRVSAIRETLQSGQRVPGTVLSVWFERDRGRLEVEYKYAGTRRAGVAISKNALTEALVVGQEIDLAVHPERPDKPLVLGLYLKAGFRSIETRRAR
jgi:hypothetical protein